MTKVLAGVIVAASVSSPLHAEPFVPEGTVGVWAIDKASNCQIPAKVYRLRAFNQGGDLNYFYFQNVGSGRVDVEQWLGVHDDWIETQPFSREVVNHSEQTGPMNASIAV